MQNDTRKFDKMLQATEEKLVVTEKEAQRLEEINRNVIILFF